MAKVVGLRHRYDDAVVLGGGVAGSGVDGSDGGVDLSVDAGEIVTVLGPNGSGKTTLFRLLSTLMPIQDGSITIGGHDAAEDPLAVRSQIGIVFQSPSLDAKLTVDENLKCQAALYGITGDELTRRRDESLGAMGLLDRRGDFCGKLSGGLKRRVEIAKTLLHRPRFLLLDEPSTGLDPSARLDLWQSIQTIASEGTAVLMTTHLLDEAERADRVVLMAGGNVVASGPPSELRAGMGDGTITVTPTSDQTDGAVERVLAELNADATKVSDQYRMTTADLSGLTATLIDRLGDDARSISVGRPSLEDVFIAKTGQELL